MAQPLVPHREITADTVNSVIKLSVAEGQKCFVVINAVGHAQALITPETWYRALYPGAEPAGFVGLFDESRRTPVSAAPKIGGWRLMVAEQFQNKGVGRDAMQPVLAHLRGKGCVRKLELSQLPADGNPEPI